jgi:hypothetical protein
MKRLICFFRGHGPLSPVANLGGGNLRVRCGRCGNHFLLSRSLQTLVSWNADYEAIQQETEELIASLRQ